MSARRLPQAPNEGRTQERTYLRNRDMPRAVVMARQNGTFQCVFQTPAEARVARPYIVVVLMEHAGGAEHKRLAHEMFRVSAGKPPPIPQPSFAPFLRRVHPLVDTGARRAPEHRLRTDQLFQIKIQPFSF